MCKTRNTNRIAMIYGGSYRYGGVGEVVVVDVVVVEVEVNLFLINKIWNLLLYRCRRSGTGVLYTCTQIRV